MMEKKYSPWLTKKAPDPSILVEVKSLLDGLRLHTICESAQCPNQGECFAQGLATFLILGDVCTRNCTFCAVKKGVPLELDPEEPQNVALAVKKLKLRHVVVTSVTRDDIPDGGAQHFALTAQTIKSICPEATIELLIPDFQGSLDALVKVIAVRPEVIGHNLETVPRLYHKVRPRASYERSLRLVSEVRHLGTEVVTKSGLMLGLGESYTEVVTTMKDLRQAGCMLFTLGQYLPPSPKHYPLIRYVPPEEFAEYEKIGQEMGFWGMASGPFVRSSYNAAELLLNAKKFRPSEKGIIYP